MGKLGPSDYFGRTMVAALPKDVKVGVVAVAMGGSPIEAFYKDTGKNLIAQKSGEWWAQLANRYYAGDPYKRLVEMAKKAQEVGVIKGILLHQGCSNNGDSNWPNMVKKIYDDILKDLNLNGDTIPLFVGETERQNMGGSCYAHNTVVAKVPNVIKNSYVISSEQLPGNGQDSWHFSAAGYRIFGKRYAFKALQVMGKETQMDPEYQMNASLKKFFTPKSVDTLFVRKAGTSLGLMLTCTYVDGHTEKIKDATYTSTDFELKQGYIVKFGEAGSKGTVTATFTDFFGEVHEVVLTIQSEGTAAINTVNADQNDSQKAVFDLQGRKVTNEPSKKGIYIVNGKKVVR